MIFAALFTSLLIFHRDNRDTCEESAASLAVTGLNLSRYDRDNFSIDRDSRDTLSRLRRPETL